MVTKCWLMGRGLKLGDWGGRLTAQLTHSYAVSFKPASHFLGALATLVGQHQQQVKEVRSLLQVTQEIVFWISARGSLLTSVFLPIWILWGQLNRLQFHWLTRWVRLRHLLKTQQHSIRLVPFEAFNQRDDLTNKKIDMRTNDNNMTMTMTNIYNTFKAWFCIETLHRQWQTQMQIQGNDKDTIWLVYIHT